MGQFVVTYIDLESLFICNPMTGSLVWKPRNLTGHASGWSARYAGKEAGVLSKTDGYLYVGQNEKWRAPKARVIWAMKEQIDLLGVPEVVDHKNGIRIDNRFINLRAASNAQNVRNKVKLKNNTTGYKGVSVRASGSIRASIMKDGKTHEKQGFSSIEEAYSWYCEKAKLLHEEFACGNKHGVL